jgi:hypothetical protein
MWLLTRKKNEFNEAVCHKASWVFFGNHQEHYAIHYFEMYLSVAWNESLKMMLSLAVNHIYAVFQFDFETAFLYGNIYTNIYVFQVLGFEHPDPKKKLWVWKLQNSLYGTKQSPRMWKVHLIQTLDSIGFKPCIIDDALFHNKDTLILLHMHVNDGFIVGKSRLAVECFIGKLKKHYSLKVKEQPNQHLGYTFDWRANGSLIVHQSDFAQKILEKFDMTNATSVKAPLPLNFHRVIASKLPSFDVKTMQKAPSSPYTT